MFTTTNSPHSLLYNAFLIVFASCLSWKSLGVSELSGLTKKAFRTKFRMLSSLFVLAVAKSILTFLLFD